MNDGGMTLGMCATCHRNADGMPPCDRPSINKRPDGQYCDCGHGRECHREPR